jgi:DNA-3-methyladenine glycosylase
VILPQSFFERDALVCARELIGEILVHGETSGRIIETEAYREKGDPACHLFTRPSAREFAESCPPGTAYVYLNYGVHWLANVLCRDAASGEAGFVLFRSLAPLSGISLMEQRRGTDVERNLCSGPGKLTAALSIGPEHHRKSLVDSRAFYLLKSEERPPTILADKRVGISAAKELRWRFLAADHPGVSVNFGRVK